MTNNKVYKNPEHIFAIIDSLTLTFEHSTVSSSKGNDALVNE